MKKIKVLIQLAMFRICLSISKELGVEHWIMNGNKYSFFLYLGPKMLIVRNESVQYLGSAFSIEAEFDTSGNILYCRPSCMNTKEGDKVFFFKANVYKEYQKYTFLMTAKNGTGTGMSMVI